ncbi:hypothetical protein SLS58_002989 [Diplodia intermedia]|uniref:Uncharacterized protein n=1 Tax=Diplodia intermedia TaxID=856260 RepID=A0ABR3TXI1_9PEZI
MKVANRLSGGLTLLLGLLLAGLTFAASAGTTDITRTLGITASGRKWGGAMIPQPPSSGHFTAVQGSFTVPKIAVPVGVPLQDAWEATIQLGFGGTINGNHAWLQQVGVMLSIDPSGSVTYHGFHLWYNITDDGAELTICEGDELMLRVESYSNTTGIAIIENHTTGKGFQKILDSPPNTPPHLGLHAEWLVSEPINDRLVNFSSITINQAVAYTSDGSDLGPGEGAALIATIQEGGRLMTETTLGSRELIVAYNPHTASRRRTFEKPALSSRELAVASKPHASGRRGAVEKRRMDPNFPGGRAGARFVRPFDGVKYGAIEGTFIVPEISLPANPVKSNFTAVVAVNIGGTAQDEEPSASVGVKLIINYDTSIPILYQPFFKMGEAEHYFDDLIIISGDLLTLRLEFDNRDGTQGNGTIINKGNTNGGGTKAEKTTTLSGGGPVEGYHAEWVVIDPTPKSTSDNPLSEPFPDFGTIDFVDPIVTIWNATKHSPADALGDLVASELIYSPEGVPMTEVLIGPRLVSIKYKPLADGQGSSK